MVRSAALATRIATFAFSSGSLSAELDDLAAHADQSADFPRYPGRSSDTDSPEERGKLFEGGCYRIDGAAKLRRHARYCALAALFQFERRGLLGRDRTLALALRLAHQFKEQVEICLQTFQVIAFSRFFCGCHRAAAGQPFRGNFASRGTDRVGRHAAQFDNRFNEPSIVQREGVEAGYMIPG